MKGVIKRHEWRSLVNLVKCRVILISYAVLILNPGLLPTFGRSVGYYLNKVLLYDHANAKRRWWGSPLPDLVRSLPGKLQGN